MGAWIRKVTKKFIIFERLNKIATLMIIQPFHKMLAASLLLVSFLSSCEKSSKVNDDGSIDIVRNGKTAYSIVYNQETSKSICDNLVLAFEDLTGASPKVVTDDSRNSKFEIIVGNTGRTETAATLAKVGENGYAKVSNVKEEELIEALIKLGSYTAINAVGVENDYESRTSTRIQEAKYYTQPSNYDTYSMYGGRMRCNVDDTGVITAFYGDSNYREDGSNGQVMIYQPKFYYQRMPSKLVDKKVGRTIRKETIIVSDTEQTGFKLHPLFKTPDGEILDYVLISAYEGGLFDASENIYVKVPSEADYDYDKLSSIAGVKPISGVVDDFTLQNAERLARNRGEGWHITNMAVESVNQMLGMVEYNTLNAQSVLGNGVSSIRTSGAGNCSSYTGSTSSLGNASGSAAQTTNEIDGVETIYSENGYKAVSYRGMENVYGNNWRFVGDTLLYGDGTKEGGEPYICNSYNYSSAINSNYSPIGFTIPSVYGWVSGFGYGNEEYDWVFMPAECSDLANSAAPIGDNLWSIADLNNTNAVLAGGNWAFGLSNGPFYYACDRTPSEPTRSYCARLMFIPTKNYVYHSNILKWN